VIFLSARYEYSKQLENLQKYVLDMGHMMEKLTRNSIVALVNQDVELAKRVIDGDDEIDDFAFEIEDRCVRLIATEQPVAKDLRIILTSLKVVTDIERMADHGVDIGKIAIRLANECYMKPVIDIPRMGDNAIEMVNDSLDAYVNRDIELAHKVCARDDMIDEMYEKLLKELNGYARIDEENIYQAGNFLLVAKYLERIADHATNICEWIVYIVTGEKKELN
jgi:phosphate transport system protein